MRSFPKGDPAPINQGTGTIADIHSYYRPEQEQPHEYEFHLDISLREVHNVEELGQAMAHAYEKAAKIINSCNEHFDPLRAERVRRAYGAFTPKGDDPNL